MERIDADAEVRHIGAADDVPGGREFVDVPAPRQALLRDADAEQQLELGLRGIVVALKDRKGECRGALGIVMQMQTMSREQMVERLLPLLRDAANMLRPLV